LKKKEFPSVILVMPVLAFMRCRVSTRKRGGRFFCLVIPAIFIQESILGSGRMDPRLKLAGMTEGEMDARHKLRV
jgi:hypothetical protein